MSTPDFIAAGSYLVKLKDSIIKYYIVEFNV